ncbi:MAG: CBS domain-containing protein [Desulfobacterales bacterium]
MNTLTVEEMMVPLTRCAAVSEQATLFEAIIALEETRLTEPQDQNSHALVLVMNDDLHVTGRLSRFDVIMSLEDGYARMGDIQRYLPTGFTPDFIKHQIEKFGLWREPLDRLCEKAFHVKAKDIMHTPSREEYVNADRKVSEALHQMISYQLHSLLVMDSQNDPIGILRLTDVFDRVARTVKSCKGAS